jgi:hypothetical protein
VLAPYLRPQPVDDFLPGGRRRANNGLVTISVDEEVRSAPRLPRYAIALVQSELEMLNTPGNELSGFLLSRPDLWRTEVFTERTFEAVLSSTERFACVILGFNAVYQSEMIQEALTDWLPETGLLVLHQLKQKGLSFLPPELTLTLKDVAAGVREAVAREHSDPRDEILLNWPEPVIDSGSPEFGKIAASVVCHLETLQAGIWRTSLELDLDSDRLPVLLRTSSMRKSRVVVCTLQLEPRLSAHASLLRNMITYCAAGWPEIAIVEDLDDRTGFDIARKLRLQGANAVELPCPKRAPIRFEDWPLRGEARQPRRIIRSNAARKWLEAGNTLVGVESGGLTFHHGASDANLIGQRWSAWFHAVDPAVWHGGPDREGKDWDGSIFSTRAVLRMLTLLRRDSTHVDAVRLGLEPPSTYALEVVALLRTRKDRSPSFEGTISTHAAAHDVLQLLGDEHAPQDVDSYVKEWLRSAFDAAGPEDRLDIARSLGAADLFRRALSELDHEPLPPVLATRIRDAAVQCSVRPRFGAKRLKELVSADLDSNLLLASEYVVAHVAFSETFKGHPAGRLNGDAMTRALATIGRFGVLARASVDGDDLDPKRLRPGVISTEARALIHYYGTNPTSTHALLPQAQGVPGAMVEAVLKTANRTRAAEVKARLETNEKIAQLSERDANLTRARNTLGGLAAAAALVLCSAMIAVLGHDLAGIVSAFGIGALLFALLSLVLNRADLAPGWAEEAVGTVAGGLWAVASALAGLFKKRDERR